MSLPLAREIHRFIADRRGNLAVAAALCLPVLVMVVGGAVDLQHAENVRLHLKDSLDAATLAATADSDMDRGRAMMGVQLDDRPDLIRWSSSFTPLGEGRVVGEAQVVLRTNFLGVIGMSTIALAAEAEAVKDGKAPPCLTLLDPAAGQALLVNSGARLISPECEVHVHSRANPAAIFNGGSTLDVARVCVAGHRIIDNGGRPARLETGCAPDPDPFAAGLPVVPAGQSCTFHGRSIDRGPVSLTPGVYCGGINFNGALTTHFAPGLYVIRGGDWNVNGGVWRGEGVTFYFEDSSRIQFNSGVDAKLSAPASGAYRNFLFFEKPGLPKSPFIFNDSKGNELDGVMYLPSRNMTYNSGSSARGDRLAMVFNTLIINQATWRMEAPQGLEGQGVLRLVR